MATKSLFAFNIKVFKLCANVHLNEKMGMLSMYIVHISLILTVVHEITLIADLFVSGLDDFERLCEDFPMVLAFLMVTYEFYNIVAQKENIEALLKHIDITIAKYQPTYAKKSYQKTKMGKIVDMMDRLGFFNIMFGLLCVELWVARPLVTRSGKMPFGNPWYPIDVQKYYIYLIIFNAYIGTLAGVNTINIHIFYAKIMAVICEQFDILKHSFMHIDESDDKLGMQVTEGEIFERVKECIKYHQKILKCCDDLQKCISGILVCQFCFGISLCFAALGTFSMNAFSGAFINLLNHIFLELSELYIFCWFSNKITEQAEMVTEGIFYSQWYKRSQRSKKLFQFIIMRCKKPVVIRAANVLPASIGSYIWILQQSYSFFMVLRQVQGEK